jgi:hypothetical protein
MSAYDGISKNVESDEGVSNIFTAMELFGESLRLILDVSNES